MVAYENEDNKKSFVRSKRKIVLEYLVSSLMHIFLLSILIAYAAAGAAMFHFIEEPHQKQVIARRANETKLRLADATHLFQKLIHQCGNMTSHHCRERLRKTILDSATSLQQPEEEYPWDYWHSLFYSGTIFTTIGYGHMACKTTLGRMITILYAIIGIPLTLTVLNDIGKMLYRHVRHVYRLVRRSIRWFYRRIYLPEMNPRLSRMSSVVTGPDDVFNPQLPLWLAFLIVVGYMCFSAVIMTCWESWDYFTSFYFIFISLSTIGFGDVLPQHPKYIIASSVFIFIGLALVSMCINVVQARLEMSYRDAVEKLNWSGSGTPMSPPPFDVTQPPPPTNASSRPTSLWTVQNEFKNITDPPKRPVSTTPDPGADGTKSGENLKSPKFIKKGPRSRPSETDQELEDDKALPKASLGVIQVGNLDSDEEEEEENNVGKQEKGKGFGASGRIGSEPKIGALDSVAPNNGSDSDSEEEEGSNEPVGPKVRWRKDVADGEGKLVKKKKKRKF